MPAERTAPYSVLMSVYGKEKPEHLRQSVESMLAQTAPPGDFVLVCDGPLTPELDDVVERFVQAHPELFQIVRLPENRGLGQALNAGLAVCRYDLVARMDSDDISVPDRCARQLLAFSDRPDLAVVGGEAAEFEQDPTHPVSVRRPPRQPGEILRYAGLRNPMNHPTVMYRKSAVLDSGGYRDAPLHEDYDLWVRMLRRGEQMCNLPRILCYMRVDGGMYARRGGLRYWRVISEFHWELCRTRFCTRSQCAVSIAAYTVSCLVPACVRRRLYQRVLRKR